MIGMGVGIDQIIDRFPLLFPKIGGHDPLPRVKAAVVGPTSVDHHHLSPGKLDNRGIRLAHVQKSNFQILGVMNGDILVDLNPAVHCTQEG